MHYRHKDVPKQLGDPKPLPKEKKPKTGLKRKGIKKKPSTLIEKLDRVFSRFVRKSSANEHGICKCYTCGVELDWKKISNGHFISRKHFATRWDLDNCRTQCNICNEIKAGNLIVYRDNLTKEKGETFVLELIRKAMVETHFSKPELEEMIQEYKEKLKTLDLRI